MFYGVDENSYTNTADLPHYCRQVNPLACYYIDSTCSCVMVEDQGKSFFRVV